MISRPLRAFAAPARKPTRSTFGGLTPCLGAAHAEVGLAIIDCSDIIDGMASITIRQLPEATKRKLRIRAAQNGRSMEHEAREILRNELNRATERKEPSKKGNDLFKSIREIFEPLGGVELKIPPRETIPEPRIK